MEGAQCKVAQWNRNSFTYLDKTPFGRQYPVILLQEARSVHLNSLYFDDNEKIWKHLNNENALCTSIRKEFEAELYLSIKDDFVTEQLINVEINLEKFRIGNICTKKNAWKNTTSCKLTNKILIKLF